MVRFEFIRHGQTEGNLEKRYIGCTDQDLCSEGILTGARLYALTGEADVWLLSPMRRCLETACLAAGVSAATVDSLIREKADAGEFLRLLALQCPESVIRIVDDLRECDFGTFENKNWQDLSGNPDYQSWIDSGGQDTFPGGERPEAFRNRCAEAFERQVQNLFYRNSLDSFADDDSAVTVRLVVHGGTIMSIMDALAMPQTPPKTYYDWHPENGEVLSAFWDGRWPIALQPEETE